MSGERVFSYEIAVELANSGRNDELIRQINFLSMHERGEFLFNAACNGHAEVLKLLIAAKADVNQARTKDGATPLYVAAKKGYAEVLKLLIEKGAHINKVRTDDGATSTHVAAENGHVEAVKMLIAAGALVNMVRTKDRATPAYIAAENGHAEVYTILRCYGAERPKNSKFTEIDSVIENSIKQFEENRALANHAATRAAPLHPQEISNNPFPLNTTNPFAPQPAKLELNYESVLEEAENAEKAKKALKDAENARDAAIEKAAKAGDDEMVEGLIFEGGDRDYAVVGYAKAGNHIMAKHHISKGGDINLAVMVYAEIGNDAMVEDLISKGGDRDCAVVGYLRTFEDFGTVQHYVTAIDCKYDIFDACGKAGYFAMSGSVGRYLRNEDIDRFVTACEKVGSDVDMLKYLVDHGAELGVWRHSETHNYAMIRLLQQRGRQNNAEAAARAANNPLGKPQNRTTAQKKASYSARYKKSEPELSLKTKKIAAVDSKDKGSSKKRFTFDSPFGTPNLSRAPKSDVDKKGKEESPKPEKSKKVEPAVKSRNRAATYDSEPKIIPLPTKKEAVEISLEESSREDNIPTEPKERRAEPKSFFANIGRSEKNLKRTQSAMERSEIKQQRVKKALETGLVFTNSWEPEKRNKLLNKLAVSIIYGADKMKELNAELEKQVIIKNPGKAKAEATVKAITGIYDAIEEMHAESRKQKEKTAKLVAMPQRTQDIDHYAKKTAANNMAKTQQAQYEEPDAITVAMRAAGDIQRKAGKAFEQGIAGFQGSNHATALTVSTGNNAQMAYPGQLFNIDGHNRIVMGALTDKVNDSDILRLYVDKAVSLGVDNIHHVDMKPCNNEGMWRLFKAFHEKEIPFDYKLNEGSKKLGKWKLTILDKAGNEKLRKTTDGLLTTQILFTNTENNKKITLDYTHFSSIRKYENGIITSNGVITGIVEDGRRTSKPQDVDKIKILASGHLPIEFTYENIQSQFLDNQPQLYGKKKLEPLIEIYKKFHELDKAKVLTIDNCQAGVNRSQMSTALRIIYTNHRNNFSQALKNNELSKDNDSSKLDITKVRDFYDEQKKLIMLDVLTTMCIVSANATTAKFAQFMELVVASDVALSKAIWHQIKHSKINVSDRQLRQAIATENSPFSWALKRTKSCFLASMEEYLSESISFSTMESSEEKSVIRRPIGKPGNSKETAKQNASTASTSYEPIKKSRVSRNAEQPFIKMDAGKNTNKADVIEIKSITPEAQRRQLIREQIQLLKEEDRALLQAQNSQTVSSSLDSTSLSQESIRFTDMLSPRSNNGSPVVHRRFPANQLSQIRVPQTGRNLDEYRKQQSNLDHLSKVRPLSESSNTPPKERFIVRVNQNSDARSRAGDSSSDSSGS
jgi:hypothetical protein